MSQLSESLKARIREQANNQCGYCRSLQQYVLGILEIEHIIPKAAGGSDDEDNLWLACRLCNGYKGTKSQGTDPVTQQTVRLYNPRQQIWSEHFSWIHNGTHVAGLTPTGRATVVALKLNNPYAVVVRKAWVTAGWHPSDT
jgi:5-methylcytosine-specific restriction endonuclease McrA